MIKVDTDFKLNSSLKSNLTKFEDKVIYNCAYKTLNYSIPIIPLSNRPNTEKLRLSTVAYGVKGSNGEYEIGSPTSYASRVYKMDDHTTNWTTGGTHSQWFEKTWKEKQQMILQSAITESKIGGMK
jgi:hypothetical protein